MATCNIKQSKAIQEYLKGIKNRAYIVTFDLLDKNEDTAFYQVHYNDKSRVAMDFKQWDVTEMRRKTNPDIAISMLWNNMKSFVHNMLDQLIEEYGENEVTVRRVMVEEDGSVE